MTTGNINWAKVRGELIDLQRKGSPATNNLIMGLMQAVTEGRYDQSSSKDVPVASRA